MFFHVMGSSVLFDDDGNDYSVESRRQISFLRIVHNNNL